MHASRQGRLPEPSERHGTYWRNQYGRYYHGVWIPLRYELIGCAFWAFVLVFGSLFVITHLGQWFGNQ
jgi:hypothetical protein